MIFKKLMVDNYEYPLGIDNKKPSFSWIIDDSSKQDNYRIAVSSSKEKLLTKEYNCWDSGIINSDETFNILYSGKELDSFTRYFYQVYVNGNESPISWFETAFLDPEKDFKAYWIGMPLGLNGSVDDVRFDFDITKNIKSARLYIAMLGAGRVYLNNELLDDSYFDGSISVYEKEIYYRTFELNPVIGHNALCLKIGYGFYGAKKIYGVLRIVYEDGELFYMPTIPGRLWNVKRDEIRQNGVYDGELIDNRYKEDWLDPNYQVTFGNWVATFYMDGPKGKLKANPNPPMRIKEVLDVDILEKDDKHILIDTLRNMTGFLTFDIKGDKDTIITIKHSEILDENKRIDVKNLRAAEAIDTIILNGDEIEHFKPLFTYHGFRYALIEISGSASITNIKSNYLRSDIDIISSFNCSDETLNKLHQMSVYTDGNNLNGVFTDCPQRDERLGWLNDLSSRMYETITNYDLRNYLSNFLSMITLQMDENEIIPDTVPYTVGATIADPVSLYTLVGDLLYTYYSDVESIRNNYDGFKKWINHLKQEADKNSGCVTYGYYGDWCPALIYSNGTLSKNVSIAFVSGISFILYLEHMKKFAKLLDYKEDYNTYSKYYDYYKNKFDEKYFDKEKKIYGSGEDTELAMSITVFKNDKNRNLWAKLLNENVVNRNYHMTCGNQGYRHLIYNLAEFGYSDTVIKLLTNPEYPGWGYTLKCGATSVWERWENAVGSDMHSFNHPMFGAYDGFFVNHILGIRYDLMEKSFKKIVIKPEFDNELSFANGYYDSIRGRIGVSYIKEKESIRASINIPFNTEAVFITTDGTIDYENNSYQKEVKLKCGINKLIIKRGGK